MISNLLLIVGIGLVVFSYLVIFIKYVLLRKRMVDGYNGFDICKEVTSNYDSINIVSSSDVIFSEYDIKRNVIRLNSKNYDSNSCFDLAVSSILAGYSLVNANNSNCFRFKSIIRKIGYIGFVALIGVILSCFIRNIGDAKIGIILLGCMLVYQYMRYQVNVEAMDEIREVLDEKIYEKIVGVINNIVNFNKISFIVMLILIVRLVVIILGI